MIYGHYDVVGIANKLLWDTDPFQPIIDDGYLYGRGTTDDKGQLLTSIKAVESFLKTGGDFPLDVKFVFEEMCQRKDIDYSRVDTAIVDYCFEGCSLNGIDLIEYLRKQGVKKIHLCTGFYDDEEICRKARKAGADSLISKPIDEGIAENTI